MLLQNIIGGIIINNTVLIGRLTKDPELKYIQGSGNAVATFTLAVDKGLSKDKKAEMESNNQPTADFIRIVVWGKQAENCANYLSKGRLIAVNGRIQTGSYEDKDGKRVYTFDVVANNVEFLEFADKQTAPTDYTGIEGFHPTDNDSIPF